MAAGVAVGRRVSRRAGAKTTSAAAATVPLSSLAACQGFAADGARTASRSAAEAGPTRGAAAMAFVSRTGAKGLALLTLAPPAFFVATVESAGATFAATDADLAHTPRSSTFRADEPPFHMKSNFLLILAPAVMGAQLISISREPPGSSSMDVG